MRTQENEEVAKTEEVNELEAQINLEEVLTKQQEKIIDDGFSGEFDEGVFKIDVGTAMSVLNDKKLKQLVDLDQKVKQTEINTDEFDNLDKRRSTVLSSIRFGILLREISYFNDSCLGR